MRKAEKNSMPPLCPKAPSAVKSARIEWSRVEWPRVEWLRSARVSWLAALSVLALACGQSAEQTSETPKEVYDVPPAIEIPIDNDPQEPPRPKGLSGRLPAGFPESLPLVLPASLIDYGLEAEERWVDVLSLGTGVESEMLATAAEAGWQSDGSSLRRGDRVVRLEFRDGHPGTVVRIFF